MKAIKDTGNTLIAAFDPYDGIGIIDSYFPKSSIFLPSLNDLIDTLKNEAFRYNNRLR